jgi:hypothetical protein
MSLKAFHLVFVALSILLCLGLGIGSLVRWWSQGGTGNLMYGVGWLAASVGLVFYGRRVLRKLKGMSYL